MFKSILTSVLFLFALSFAQYDYNLEDLNPSSEFFSQNVGTSLFSGSVTLHYFGHYN